MGGPPENMMLTLYIGNKNYSSWSMRPWVLMKQLQIPFQEQMVRFDSFDGDSRFKQAIAGVNPAGKVPVLVDEGFPVWDTLAITEYLAERFPDKGVWPQDRQARARARSVCAEMHSGFSALRSHCPMNVEASLPDIGAKVWQEQAAVRSDVERIVSMWSGLLQQSGGPMLFGLFSAADAYFAPVCLRLKNYGLPVPPAIGAYVERVLALPGVKAWNDDALKEHDFIPFDEPYRTSR
jgi:glutathione S-transferase